MKFVIIGSGIAGLTAAETIRKNSSSAEITIISQDQYIPYYRINLIRYAVGELDKDKLHIHNSEWYSSKGINLTLNQRASYIDTEKKIITLNNELKVKYDRLIIATGSNAFVPPIKGINTKGIYTISSFNDAEKIKQNLTPEKVYVCLGGGVLGLEAAVALSSVTKNIYVIENTPFLMPKQLNREAGKLLERYIKSFGVNVITSEFVSQVISQNGEVSSIIFKSGKQIKADIIILATGTKPNIELPLRSGIKTNIGIIINNYMETSAEHIFAAGDAVELNNEITGTWMSALQQGKTVAMNAIGSKCELKIPPKTFTLKVAGITLASIGKLSTETDNSTTYEKIEKNTYAQFTINDFKIINAILIEYPKELTTIIKNVIDNKITINNLTKDTSVNEIIEKVKAVAKQSKGVEMNFEPKIDKSVFIADGAKIIGNVIIGKNSSVWYNSIIRCDFENTEIKIGENTNIQDGSVIHVDNEGSTYIGNNVTIGHNCIIHACTIEDNCIIGMGAIILSGATIKSNSIVGAGSLVKENSTVNEGMLTVGVPAKTVKEVSAKSKSYIKTLAEEYVKFSEKHKKRTFPIVKG